MNAQIISAKTSHPPRPDSALEFYEGRWTRTDFSTGSLKNLLVKKQRFFLSELGGKKGKLLDLGCGGGWNYFAQFGRVIGLDLSYTSLQCAKQIYSLAIQGSATTLPFADASFDFVVSQDLLGHIPLKDKDQLLAEIYRVLKPGGRTIHYIEVSGQDLLSTFARRYPDLYRRYILAPEGHIGIESLGATFQRFRNAQFVPICESAAYKGAIYLERFIQYFDNEYREKSRFIRFLVTVLKPLAKIRLLALIVNLMITLGFEVFDIILPQDWAGGALVCYTKGLAPA